MARVYRPNPVSKRSEIYFIPSARNISGAAYVRVVEFTSKMMFCGSSSEYFGHSTEVAVIC
jgi:hypothetical protein